MQSPEEVADTQQLEKAQAAFRTRMMQNALFHRIDGSLDALDGTRFQQLGFFQDVSGPVPNPIDMAVLEKSDHPARIALPAGPIIAYVADKRRYILEPVDLLVHDDHAFRACAFEYFLDVCKLPDPWLTHSTIDVLNESTKNISSSDKDSWQKAGLAAAIAVQGDILAQFAALRQSLILGYQDGVNQQIERLLRPTFDELGRYRPPLWDPKEQREEINAWIEEASQLATIEEALSYFVRRAGYVPLDAELGPPAVVKLWAERNASTNFNWDTIWAWAEAFGGPLVKCHAVCIALNVPSVRASINPGMFWEQVVEILKVSEPTVNDAQSGWEWWVYCKSAAHYIRHVEALYPGQDGDRIGCYALWLAEKFARSFRKPENMKSAVRDFLDQELPISEERLSIARSPIVPTLFRTAAMSMTSVWAFALLSELRRSERFVSGSVPSEHREKIASIIQSQVVSAPLCDQHRAPEQAFAFHSDPSLTGLGSLDQFANEEQQTAWKQISAFRNRLTNDAELRSHLDRILELPEHERFLVILFLTDAASFTTEYDEVISAWLSHNEIVVRVLREISREQLEPLCKSLAEFHQRQHAEWIIRLPHLFAFALEGVEGDDRARLLIASVLLMSINAGIASPIQRIESSKWRLEVHKILEMWRETIKSLSHLSEPWVRARVRATSAVISRLIGPQKYPPVGAGPYVAATTSTEAG
jgi:hypothetical protein